MVVQRSKNKKIKINKNNKIKINIKINLEILMKCQCCLLKASDYDMARAIEKKIIIEVFNLAISVVHNSIQSL
jgi:molybdenum cofactor biosynthesis enzyme